MKIIRLLSIFVLLLSAGLSAETPAQDGGVWKRVYTGDGYMIEVNISTVEFDVDRILRTQIRTVFDKEEQLKDGAKSKTRLEKVEYQLQHNDYRVVQVVLLDSSGKTVQTTDLDAPDWKPLKVGGMMHRVLLAARPGLPFGKWKVTSYRLAEGDGQNKEAAAELQRLVGILISLEAEAARVDQSVCGSPAYQSHHFTVDELSRKLGSDIKLPEVQTDLVDLIYVNCESGGWEPPQSMLVKLPEGRMLMLWKGVFLTLKRA